MSLLCRLGLHRWMRTGNRTRHCVRDGCGCRQVLQFYSNRTHEWETVVKGRYAADRRRAGRAAVAR